jgi:hypothetical protein
MRLPRLRFTVRRLMIAVAIVAVLIVAGLHVETAIRFSRRASIHAGGEVFWREQEQWHREMAKKLLTSHERLKLLRVDDTWNIEHAESFNLEADKIKSWADFHASMKAKYRAAARRPWLPVEPDPPSPKL